MTRYFPDEGEVKDAWVDFRVDHSNTPLSYDEAVLQYDLFLRRIQSDAIFDYADYLEATASIYADATDEPNQGETERFVEALRARGHQVKEGS